jgi:hypothetical protein
MYRAEMTDRMAWLRLESRDGDTYVDPTILNADEKISVLAEDNNAPFLLRKYSAHGDVVDFDMMEGFGVRWNAPGYLDCGEWDVFIFEDEAKARFKRIVEDLNMD